MNDLKIPAKEVKIPATGLNSSFRSSCTVPAGYTTCTSECLFTDCCVVWDPKVETGGCACFLGFGSCKTSAILTEAPAKTYSDTRRTISIYRKNIDAFWDYCESNGIETGAIKKSYKNKLIPSILGGDYEKSQVDPAAYDSFFSEYKIFVEQLAEYEKKLISDYVEEKI